MIPASLTVTNLHPYYIYAYHIAAFTVDTGPYSLGSYVQMPQAGKSDLLMQLMPLL